MPRTHLRRLLRPNSQIHKKKSTKHIITKRKLREILQPSTSKSLLEMSRMDTAHRQKPDNFEINLKRKLRLELWPEDDVTMCSCGQIMDNFGDHAFCCKTNVKTTMHNEIRDGIFNLFKRILPTAKLISTATAVEKELEQLLPLAPSLRPFDVSVKLDHLLGDQVWRTPLNRIGFDVYVISSNASSSTKSQTNQKKLSKIRLRDGEKEKFYRKGHTEKGTNITLSGDEVVGEVLKTNSALIPVTVMEFGQFGSLFERFLFGKEAMKIPNFKTKPEKRKSSSRLGTLNQTAIPNP